MMAVTVERALELPFRLLCVPWSQKVKRSRERERDTGFEVRERPTHRKY